MRRLSPLLALVVVGQMLLAGSAIAESPADADCNTHNALTEHFTVGELQTALATMPAAVKEYTGCYQTIQNQLYAELGHSGKTGPKASTGSGGSFLSAPVLIVLVLILAGGGGFAFMAWRRNGAGDGEGP
jgi:hypothetical protein